MFHVERGLVSFDDRYGNHQADKLATAAAAQQTVSREFLVQARMVQLVVSSVQAMMVATLETRNNVARLNVSGQLNEDVSDIESISDV
eukprot:5593625-Karenia_brevis.AAC.1